MHFFRRFASFLILLPVLVLFFNHTNNWHFHYDDVGVLVKHAHPVGTVGKPLCPSDNPSNGHQHTPEEMRWLAFLSEVNSVEESSDLEISFCPGYIVVSSRDSKHLSITSFIPGNPPLRAPPEPLL